MMDPISGVWFLRKWVGVGIVGARPGLESTLLGLFSPTNSFTKYHPTR